MVPPCKQCAILRQTCNCPSSIEDPCGNTDKGCDWVTEYHVYYGDDGESYDYEETFCLNCLRERDWSLDEYPSQ